jgi:hypothetical protein
MRTSAGDQINASHQYSRAELKEALNGICQTIKNSALDDVVNGSHPTCNQALIRMAVDMNLKTNDLVMDIGVGVPRLALFFSHLTNRPTIGTDIG